MKMSAPKGGKPSIKMRHVKLSGASAFPAQPQAFGPGAPGGAGPAFPAAPPAGADPGDMGS